MSINYAEKIIWGSKLEVISLSVIHVVIKEFNVLINKKKWVTIVAFSALFPCVASAEAINETLAIKNLAPVAAGWIVAFKSLPKGCSTDYNGFHAFMDKSDTDIVADIMVARSVGIALSIRYENRGTCSQESDLVKITDTK